MEDRNIPSAGAEEATYSTAARRFHWWTVLLIAAQVPIGLFMVRYGAATNFAEPTGKLYDAHKLIGLTILLLALVRLVYRLAHGAPADEPTLADVQAQYPHWACTQGISGFYHATHHDSGQQVTGEDPPDLRDQIKTAEARHHHTTSR